MDIRTYTRIARARASRGSYPVYVSLTITDLCNCACRFCSLNQGTIGHAGDDVIRRVAEETAALKIYKVSITGGEPLLHPKIGHAVNEFKKRGARVAINTNGTLVSQNMDLLKRINGAGLSIEGERETHEEIRGPGTFDSLFEALELLSAVSIPLKLTCVISKNTRFEDVQFAVETAQRYKTAVNFQPATLSVNGGEAKNPLSPPESHFGEIINGVIELKKENPRFIINSMPGLKHIAHWPHNKRIYCGAVSISCNIYPDGGIFGCVDMPNAKPSGNILDTGIPEALRNARITGCSSCWCGERVEVNMMLTPKTGAAFNYLKVRNGYD